jgi:hypothetical protein
LELHLLSIESGKFVVDAEYPGFDDGDGLVTQGWRSESAGASGGKEDGGDEEPQPKKRNKTEDDGLIPDDVLNKYPAIPPFARVFLSRAKKPRFAFIAPQLDAPDEAFVHRVGQTCQQSSQSSLSFRLDLRLEHLL